jgi:hypothetical protein
MHYIGVYLPPSATNKALKFNVATLLCLGLTWGQLLLLVLTVLPLWNKNVYPIHVTLLCILEIDDLL